jgi:hypothetical protein
MMPIGGSGTFWLDAVPIALKVWRYIYNQRTPEEILNDLEEEDPAFVVIPKEFSHVPDLDVGSIMAARCDPKKH